jgi:hypothetical protein
LVIDQVIVDTLCTAPGDGDVPAFRPCWRGQANSTFQYWMFGVSNNPAAIPAELATNAFGVPHASIAFGFGSDGYIASSSFLGCRQGIWDLGQSGTMTLTIPNTTSASSGAYKYVRVQVTQYRGGPYNQNATVSIAGGTLVSQQQTTIETVAPGRTWVVAQSIWRLGPPCPASESVVITAGPNGSLIDQVVVDTLCLDFACPPDITGNADAGQCSKANVTWTLPAANGCTVANVTSTPVSGSTFSVGTTWVTNVITDGEGGTRICAFKVTVADTQPPTVICPGDITVARDPAQCGAFVAYSPTASDNCGSATAGGTPASGSLFPLGLTTVSCTATDAASNVSAPCTFAVRVVDFTGDVPALAPCWRGQPNTTFQQWAFSVSNNPAALPAELVTNAFGVPQASIAFGYGSDGYIDSNGFLGCQQGIWDLGQAGTMTLALPNSAGPGTSYKYVWVQVTQYRDNLYNQNATVSIAGATLVSQQPHLLRTVATGRTWVVDQTVWRIGPPCPGSESVLITAGPNGSLIDQVVVDTRRLDNISPAGTPTVGIQAECANITFLTGGSYTWDLANATGGAGAGWDLLNVTGAGTIDVQSTSGNPFAIRVNTPLGGPSNFDPHQSYDWTIATTGGGLLNFDPAKFAIDASGFQGSLAGDGFALKTANSGKDLVLYLTHPPTVPNVVYYRAANTPWKIKVTDLVANATPQDPGDTLSLVSVGGASHGTVGLIMAGTYVGYTPTPPDQNLQDTFTYTVKDNNNGLQSSGTVTLNVSPLPPGGEIISIAYAPGQATLTCTGVPGYTYDLQRSPIVEFTSPTVVLTTNAPLGGVFIYVDSNPPQPDAFYRLKLN